MKKIEDFQIGESRINESDYQEAINKLLYEINLRKEEFLMLCQKNDPGNNFKLKPEIFKLVLNQYTVYPNDYEKNLIIHKYTVDDEYIDYMNISNLKPNYTILYKDIFLQHLNKINDKIDNSEMFSSANKMGSAIDLTPLEKLNCGLNEENFITKICKNIINYISTSSKGKRPYEFLDELFKKNDFDNDGYFTIGEVNNFLNNAKIYLADSDLKFFFEYFPLFHGRIEIEQLNDIIKTNSQRKLEQTVKTQYHEEENVKTIKIEEAKEDKYYDEILRNNYIVNVLKECILIFGKTFLLKYFSKYLEFHNNEFYIDNSHLEAGLNSLGYKNPTPVDSDNFMIVCIFKGIATSKSDGTHSNINIEKLFQFLIDYFKLNYQIKKCNPDELINRIGIGLVGRMNDCYLSSVTNHLNEKKVFDLRINEFEFRRKFIQSFGFIDHSFMDKQVHNLCTDDDDDNDNDPNSIKRMGIFSLKYIGSKKFLELAYNISFMNMIKNYSSLGLIFDNDDIEQLNKIYIKMQKILFPNDDNDEYYNFDYNSLGLKAPAKVFQPKLRESDTISNTNSNSKSGKKVYVLADFSKKSLKINDMTPKEQLLLKQKNDNFNLRNKLINKQINPVIAIPKIHNICVKYLVEEYGLSDIRYDFISNIGICRIFKDDFNRQGINMNKKTHWNILIRNLEHLVTEDAKDFLTQIAFDMRDSDGNLMIPSFFAQLEEILLQYTKIEQKKYNLNKEKYDKKQFL